MPTIFWILLVLAGALAVTVMLTQRFGRPLQPAEQGRLGRWLVGLVLALLVARLLAELF